MDTSAVIPIRSFTADAEPASGAQAKAIALVEIDAAIALVVGGAARRVRLTGLPFVADVAATGLAHAQAAGVAFAVEPPARIGVATVTIGPRA